MPCASKADVRAATDQPDCATRGAADARTSKAVGQTEHTVPCCGSKESKKRDRSGEWAKAMRRAYDKGMGVGIESVKHLSATCGRMSQSLHAHKEQSRVLTRRVRLLKRRVGLLKRRVGVLRKKYEDCAERNTSLIHQLVYEREDAQDTERRFAEWLHYEMGPGEPVKPVDAESADTDSDGQLVADSDAEPVDID